MSIPISDREPHYSATSDASKYSDAEGPHSPQGMRAKRPVAAVIAALALLMGLGAYYYFWSRGIVPVAPVASEAPVPVASPAAPAEPAIQHPIGKVPGADAIAATPLVPLDQSDTMAMDAIATILNGDAALRLLIPENVIRQIVATVDNLPRQTMSTRVLPVKPVPSAFETVPGPAGATLPAHNSTRYAPYVHGAEAIDTSRLVGLYVRLYPLFQQAYMELGYPNGYFNDRLVAVIDHLLAAPELQGAVDLTQPKVLYQYADPDLEARSSGQKIMMRVGLDNERRLKAKLREIRKALVAEAPKP